MLASCAPARTRPALELADIVRTHGEAFAASRWLRPEDRAVQDRRARRPSRRVHRMRRAASVVQLVSQSALPQVPGDRASEMDRAAARARAARALLPRRLHAPGGAARRREAFPQSRLR